MSDELYGIVLMSIKFPKYVLICYMEWHNGPSVLNEWKSHLSETGYVFSPVCCCCFLVVCTSPSTLSGYKDCIKSSSSSHTSFLHTLWNKIFKGKFRWRDSRDCEDVSDWNESFWLLDTSTRSFSHPPPPIRRENRDEKGKWFLGPTNLRSRQK